MAVERRLRLPRWLTDGAKPTHGSLRISRMGSMPLTVEGSEDENPWDHQEFSALSPLASRRRAFYIDDELTDVITLVCHSETPDIVVNHVAEDLPAVF